MDGVAISVSICEDLWVEGGRAERCAVENGVGAVLNISASPFHAGKLSARRDIVCGFAKRTGAFVCYNNLVGGQDELVFDGGSVVAGPDGGLLATAKRFEEDLLLADIEIEGVSTGASSGRSGNAPGRPIVLESFPGGRRKSIERAAAPHLGRLEEVYEGLVLGTRDYVRKNGFEKVVLGLSGGIDSSLTAAVAVDALGEGNVVGIRMPSQYTSKETFSDAALVAANLNVRTITVPVDGIFSAYLDALKEAFGPGEHGIESENLQARIRGNILMALSNRFGWLVLTTGNKSETAVGYCTLYGDMAGGFAVIKDVPKTLVYELTQHVNEKAGRDVIPRSVSERAPSAELKPDQKDEDALPPYGVLDPILQAYVEEDRAPDEIAQGGFDSGVVDDVLRMVDGSEYKRRQAPPGVKITPKAFGRDRRLPITNRYRAGKSRE
jgi:NAD+ synthase (glutamine-hydrolysing)